MAQFAKRYPLPIFLMTLVVIFAAVAAYLYWPRTPELPVIKKAADFSMQNVDGKTVTLQDMNGKAKLFYYYFASCPDVCPPTTFMLSQVQDMLKEKGVFGTDVNIVSITFDPKRDSLERLQEWSQKNKADLSGWYFLRGDEAATANMMDENGSKVIKDKDGNFTHTNYVTLVDQDGRIRKLINANDVSITPTQMAESIVKDVMSIIK
ncbi:SCO family protein [Paenibacillus sp. 481]|uniref:SCO family protein n=1 Tax=Paenibacillus sp. 481 TaxID=2835869 RepID=UPI001E622D22|nr:SCO family protein [Paenibacillus sp. 481]UHA74639.1 SCO family protein [Paenibacillus sp. 481]